MSRWKCLALLLAALLLAGCGPEDGPGKGNGEPPKKNLPKKKPKDDPKKKIIDDGPPAEIPKVALSEEQEKTCKVRQNEKMPAFALRDLAAKDHALAGLLDKKAAVLVFWNSQDRNVLVHLDIEAQNRPEIRYVTINVGEPLEKVQQAVEDLEIDLPVLLDPDKAVFNQVATAELPRVYLLDPQGKVLWFNIGFQPVDTKRKLNSAINYVLKPR